jgi:hypothetical protein
LAFDLQRSDSGWPVAADGPRSANARVASNKDWQINAIGTENVLKTYLNRTEIVDKIDNMSDWFTNPTESGAEITELISGVPKECARGVVPVAGVGEQR